MKKIIKILLFPLIALGGFFAGFLVRQPGINKLRKQAQLLQNDNEEINKNDNNKNNFFILSLILFLRFLEE